MSKRIFTILGIIVTLVWIIATIYAFAFYGRSDNINTSTPDEMVASMDSATPDIIEVVIGPTVREETEAPTEKPTEAPTAAPTKAAVKVEETEPNIIEETVNNNYGNSSWNGEVLNPFNGVVYGPSGKETYYNLDMSGVISIMRSMGNTDEYWIREDGCKMLGDYIMCAANLDVRPRGSLVESSLGTCIVCDTGGFAYSDPYQLDIAVNW